MFYVAVAGVATEPPGNGIRPRVGDGYLPVYAAERGSPHRAALRGGRLVDVVREAMDKFGDLLLLEDSTSWRARKSHIKKVGFACSFVHPMHVAAGSHRCGTLEVLKYFIEEKQLPVMRPSYQNITALHCTIAAKCRNKTAYLVSRCTPRQLDTISGGIPALPVSTPLAFAAFRGNMSAVEEMVARGGDINRYSQAPEELWPGSCRWVSPLIAAIAGNTRDDWYNCRDGEARGECEPVWQRDPKATRFPPRAAAFCGDQA